MSQAERQGASSQLPEPFVASPERFFMEWIPGVVAAYPEVRARFGDVHAVPQIELHGEDGGVWHFALGGGEVRVHRGAHEAPTFTLSMGLAVWRRLLRGEVNGLTAFLKGEIKLRGSWLAFLRLARRFG